MDLFQIDEQQGLEVIKLPGLPDLSGYVPEGKDVTVEDVEDDALYSGFWVEQQRAGSGDGTRAAYFEDPDLVDKEVQNLKDQYVASEMSRLQTQVSRDDISPEERANARQSLIQGAAGIQPPDARFYSYDPNRMPENIELYLDRVDPDGRLDEDRRASIAAGIYAYGMKNEGGFSTRLIGMEQEYSQSKASANYRNTADMMEATASTAIPTYINEGLSIVAQLGDLAAMTDLDPAIKETETKRLTEAYTANSQNMAAYMDRDIARLQAGVEALGRDYGVTPAVQSEYYNAARKNLDRAIITSGGTAYGLASVEGQAAQTAAQMANDGGYEPSEINRLGAMDRTVYNTGAIRDTISTFSAMTAVRPGGLSDDEGIEQSAMVSEEVMAVIEAYGNDMDVQSYAAGEEFKARVLNITGNDESFGLTGKLSAEGTALMREVSRDMAYAVGTGEMRDEDAAGIMRDIKIAKDEMTPEESNDLQNNLRREYIDYRMGGKMTMESWLHSVRSYPASMVDTYRSRHRPVSASDEYIRGIAPILAATAPKYRNAVYEEAYARLSQLEDPTGDQIATVEFMIADLAAMAADGQSLRYEDAAGRTGTVSSSPEAARQILADDKSLQYEETVFAVRPNSATGVQGFTNFGDFTRGLMDVGFSEADANDLAAASGAMGGNVLRTMRNGVPGSIVVTGDPMTYNVGNVEHEFIIGFELEDSVEVRGSGKARNLRHPDFDVLSQSDQTVHTMAAVEIIDGQARYRAIQVEGTGANMRITKVSDYDESVTVVPGLAVQRIANNSRNDLIGVATDEEMMSAYFDYLKGRTALPEGAKAKEQLGADSAASALAVAANVDAVVNNTGLELPIDTSANLDFRLEKDTLHLDLFGYAIGRVDGAGNKMPMQLPLGTITNAEGFTVDEDANYSLAEDFYTAPPESEPQQIIIPPSITNTIETIWETEGLRAAQEAVARMMVDPLFAGIDFDYVGGDQPNIFEGVGEGIKSAAEAVGGFFKRIRPGVDNE